MAIAFVRLAYYANYIFLIYSDEKRLPRKIGNSSYYFSSLPSLLACFIYSLSSALEDFQKRCGCSVFHRVTYTVYHALGRNWQIFIHIYARYTIETSTTFHLELFFGTSRLTINKELQTASWLLKWYFRLSLHTHDALQILFLKKSLLAWWTSQDQNHQVFITLVKLRRYSFLNQNLQNRKR